MFLSQSKIRDFPSENKYFYKNEKTNYAKRAKPDLWLNKGTEKKSVGQENILVSLADIHIHMDKWNRISSISPIRNGILLMKNTFKHYDPIYQNSKCKLLAVMVL